MVPAEAVAVPSRQVRKRDNHTLQPFDEAKIAKAVRAAWAEVGGEVNEKKVQSVVATVIASTADLPVIDIEEVQNSVETALMVHKLVGVAKAYILYRQKRAEARAARKSVDPLAIQNYIHVGKYARYRSEWRRRETYLETVARDEAMHQRRFPQLKTEITWAFDRTREKKALPSMRSMQFGGEAIEKVHNRIYNCSFSLVDRPRIFAEALYLLLCGCGVGYSVQFEHVDRLPSLGNIDFDKVVHYTVADSIEGWADALDALVQSYMVPESPYYGALIEFNYSLIRPKGAPLKTSGGKAPGHRQLKASLEQIRTILDGAQSRQLRPIECHDMMCHAADAVLSGGIRRSAMIALFSLADGEMMNAKTGNWFNTMPWRQNANNSVMLKRDEIKKKDFKRIFKATRQWGEPGFYFCWDLDSGTNPCGEISLNPNLTVDADVLALLKKRASRGKPMPEIKHGQHYTGWAFCNLCELNASLFKSLDDFMESAKAATIIGTLQAAYTDMPYLGWVSEVIAEREALLGIGMTGMMDAPEIALNPEYQRLVAQMCIEVNAEIAERIGIRPASRLTCVKPSGTTSKALGNVANGHHAHHARRYINRVIAKDNEPQFLFFKERNPHMCQRKPNGDWVIEFPVAAPAGAIIKDDLTAIQFLEMVKSTQMNWVMPGTARPGRSPGLCHNVSNTCIVKPDEWDAVAEYLWDNREYFSGVTLLAATGDKEFAYAPQEAVVTEADEAYWNKLVAGYVPVDYTEMIEQDDATDLSSVAACSGDKCEMPTVRS